MKFTRLSFLILLSGALTSCGTETGAAFKNSFPVKFLDQAGAEMLGWLGENNLPTDGKPASMRERAREVESRGHYARLVPAAAVSRQSMAAR